jgi:signal transduction histidine kinase
MDPATPPAVRELVDLAQEETGRAIAELRELARGIHPAALVEGGLAAALRGLALRSPVDATVDADERRLPESVEIALYYVAAEALANVVKHAGARRVDVVLRIDDEAVTLDVADDGAGGADLAGGSGLAGLVDRLEAIGGTLAVDGEPGRGSRVTARAPLR